MLTRKLTSAVIPLSGILRSNPMLWTLLRQLRIELWRFEISLRGRQWQSIPDVNRRYWVSPDRIRYMSTLEGYDKFGDRGKVIGGDWDLNIQEFTNLDVYSALDERMNHNVPWKDTDFYLRVLEEIDHGKVKWHCRSKDEFELRLQYLENLYHEIQKNGFRTQIDLSQDENLPYAGEDEITVRIGRDGLLLFEDGRHRLSIAKLLNLEKVPIKVTVRHKEWYRFTKEVREYARRHGGKVYQPIAHPDLSDIPSKYGNERFELIKRHRSKSKGNLLDIGANWGYFCHRFEDLGWNCFAVERGAKEVYFLKKLRIAEGKRFEVIDQSIFDYDERKTFDIVLALNIFHHFLKREDSYYLLIDLLGRLRMQTMYFQAHEPESPQMKDSYRNYNPDEFVAFIIDNSMLNTFTYLGETSDGRPMFCLSVS